MRAGPRFLDLIVPSGYLEILLGNANGTFKAVTDYVTLGNQTADAAFGDFNGDGKVDVVDGTGGSYVFTLSAGKGDGMFLFTDVATLAKYSDPLTLPWITTNGPVRIDVAPRS